MHEQEAPEIESGAFCFPIIDFGKAAVAGEAAATELLGCPQA